MELSDDPSGDEEEEEDEDEPTLSLSQTELAKEPPTAGGDEAERDRIELVRKRSMSESEGGTEPGRLSRRTRRSVGSGRTQKGFEETQSMDRSARERSPVFFLEPDDWIRTEGSSPFPWTGSSRKLLDSLSSSLNVLSESEENLNPDPELEQISPSDPPTVFRRSQSMTPSLLVPRSESSPGLRSRSVTPARGLLGLRRRSAEEERQRKVTIPILCQRHAMRVGSRVLY